MADRFVVTVYDGSLTERIGHDGSVQQSPYRPPRPFTVEDGEWCPFLLCLERGPHEHAVCWLCEAVRYGNAFCPACRAHWHPDPSLIKFRLMERLN